MRTVLSFLVCATIVLAADTAWTLEQSTLTYHLSHPLHQVDGVSHAARGKAVCHSGQCDLLVAVPVKTFDSGDSNRDLHMLQLVRGAQFPMVTVRLRIPEDAAAQHTVRADIEITFAGQTATFKQAPFEVTVTGNQAHVTGTIPATMSDFKIEPPTLLGIATKNEMPIKVDVTWRRQ
jgi:hypothetical protein